MRVRIEDLSVFECKDPTIYRELRRLFERASKGQHEIDIDDPEYVLASDFNSQASAAIDRLEWEELIRRTSVNPFLSLAQPAHYAVVGMQFPLRAADSSFYLAVSDLGDWVEQPLRILLENTRDQVLVTLCIHFADADSPLQQALNRKWLTPEGCGGSGEVLNRVRNARNNERLFAIVDSDCETIGGDISTTAELIGIAGKARGMDVCVLARRELENYIPETIWSALVPSPKRRSPRDRDKQRRAAKVVDVYQWLARRLHDARKLLSRLHSQAAVDKVIQDIESKAERRIAAPLVFERLLEWKRMTMAERSVDDLKIRFGKSCAEDAVTRMSNVLFPPAELDANAQTELKAIAKKIEEWL